MNEMFPLLNIITKVFLEIKLCIHVKNNQLPLKEFLKRTQLPYNLHNVLSSPSKSFELIEMNN